MARILVVEDDASQLDLRRCLLEAGGHEALLAFSPSEAIKQLGAADLVLMDLRFPNAEGKSDPEVGLSLIGRIRELRPRVPLLVLSGWPEVMEGRPEAQSVTSVLTKPISMQGLLDAVSQALGRTDQTASA